MRHVRRTVCAGGAAWPFVPDPGFGWRHKAGVSIDVHGCLAGEYEFRTTVSFNSHGLRGPDYPIQRPEAGVRVLVLGDSVLEAMQVEPKFGTVQRLRGPLSRRCGGVQLINAAHSAFGTDNQVLFWETEGVDWKPDVVVSEFNFADDVIENLPALHRQLYGEASVIPKADLRLAADGSVTIDPTPLQRFAADFGWGSRLAGWASDRLVTLRLLREAWRGLLGPAPEDPGQAMRRHEALQTALHSEPESKEWIEAWALTEALYRRLAADVEAAGARLLVLLVPSRRMLETAMADRAFKDPASRRIQAILESAGIDFVDATDEFVRHERETGRSPFFAWDVHPQRDGHALLAGALAAPLAAAVMQSPRCRAAISSGDPGV